MNLMLSFLRLLIFNIRLNLLSDDFHEFIPSTTLAENWRSTMFAVVGLPRILLNVETDSGGRHASLTVFCNAWWPVKVPWVSNKWLICLLYTACNYLLHPCHLWLWLHNSALTTFASQRNNLICGALGKLPAAVDVGEVSGAVPIKFIHTTLTVSLSILDAMVVRAHNFVFQAVDSLFVCLNESQYVTSHLRFESLIWNYKCEVATILV